MTSAWVINPEVDTVDTLYKHGRFLKDDYRMVIENLYVPETFEPFSGSTGRKFILVGGAENPILLARSLFLCIKLSGADSIIVKTDNVDEHLIAHNIFSHHGSGIKHELYTGLDSGWMRHVEESTDIVVFGDDKVSKAFRDYETVDRRVWEYGYKFSFGIVKSESLSPRIINDICFDFFSFYGVGRLAPKFYFVIGKLTKKDVKAFSNNIRAMYREMIEEYIGKLPLTKKSEVVQRRIDVEYALPFVEVVRNNPELMFDNLYGDVKLIPVENLEEVEEFIEEWNDQISTVAVNIDDDWDTLDMLEDAQVNRICPYGDMQFPDFWEQYDSVDDYSMYTPETTEEEL